MPFDAMSFVGTDVQRVLKDAKARIGTPELWCKGRLFHDNEVCAIGAIMVATNVVGNVNRIDMLHAWNTATNNNSMEYQLYRAAVDALEKQIRTPGYGHNDFGVASYNNAHTTTHDDMMAWFDRAIESCA